MTGHFFPSYTFDLDNTIYLFTSGRYEYRNKGMDLFIEALHRLNWRLKGVPDRPTVVAFIITKAADAQHQRRRAPEPVDVRRPAQHLQRAAARQMGQRLFNSAAGGRMPTFAELMGDESQVRLKRAMHAWRTNRQPLIVTHDLGDDASDPVLRHLRHREHVQRRRRPGEGRLPPRLPLRHQPADQPGLRAVRPRLPHGRLPQLLRAVGLHADGMHGAWACPA